MPRVLRPSIDLSVAFLDSGIRPMRVVPSQAITLGVIERQCRAARFLVARRSLRLFAGGALARPVRLTLAILHRHHDSIERAATLTASSGTENPSRNDASNPSRPPSQRALSRFASRSTLLFDDCMLSSSRSVSSHSCGVSSLTR